MKCMPNSRGQVDFSIFQLCRQWDWGGFLSRDKRWKERKSHFGICICYCRFNIFRVLQQESWCISVFWLSCKCLQPRQKAVDFQTVFKELLAGTPFKWEPNSGDWYSGHAAEIKYWITKIKHHESKQKKERQSQTTHSRPADVKKKERS